MYEYCHYKQNITVATNDTDFKARITPGAVMGYFQDIATVHAEALGFGYHDLWDKNIAWVILRMSIKILKCPAIGETLELVTFPERPKAADVGRGYYAYDKAGELVLCGSSKWCVIDVNTHRIQRLAPLFEKHDLETFIPNPPFDDANPKLHGMPAECVAEGPFSYSVQVTDLDRNIHMNNARYGDVVLNVCGMETLEKQRVSRLDINFMSELFAGDRYDAFKAQKDGITFVEAAKAPDIVFRARVEWEGDLA